MATSTFRIPSISQTTTKPSRLRGTVCPLIFAFVNIDLCLTNMLTDDNQGPPSVSQVIGFHQTLANEFPGAKIIASSISNFVRNLSANAEVVASLEVVEDEIGDTWYVETFRCVEYIVIDV